MSQPLDRIADTMVDAIPTVIAGAEAGPPIMLPRGADPFAGADRPLLLAATRWTAVSPGGVILGGTPEALATVLGFELPARPEVSNDNAGQARRATDQPVGEEGEDGDASDEPAAEAEPEPEPEAAPEAATEGDAEAGEGDAAEGDEPPAPAPTRRWSDHVADATRQPAADAGDGLIRALATLAGLPPGAAATQTVLADNDGMVSAAVGPLPDAIVVPVRRDGVEVRLVVVVAGIISARVAAAAIEVGSTSGPAAAPVDGVDAEPVEPAEPVIISGAFAAAALGGVPLELSAELGTARMPLSSVLALREGAVIDLQESVDAPVALVAGTTTVAAGALELDEAGTLVLHVTSIPGRPDLTAGPSLVADAPVDLADADAAPASEPVVPDEPSL